MYDHVQEDIDKRCWEKTQVNWWCRYFKAGVLLGLKENVISIRYQVKAQNKLDVRLRAGRKIL